MFTRLALGIDSSGAALNLVALGRRFRSTAVLGALRLPNAADPGVSSKVSAFLDRYRLREARVVASLPREMLLVRFLDLPAEAEPRLTQVVGYQIDGLHPFAEGQVYWDCALVARRAEKKQISVMVVMVEKSRLSSHLGLLKKLGLRVSSLTLSAACLAPLGRGVLPSSALVLCARDTGLELLGFDRGDLCATRDLPLEPVDSLAERFEREMHSIRAALAADSGEIPTFSCGTFAPALEELVRGSANFPQPKLGLSQPPGFDLVGCFPAFTAAYAGLSPRSVPSINLLPLEERWQPRRGVRLPIYALATTAALLAILVLGHGVIENIFYARALDREIGRLSSRASDVRRQSQQVNALVARGDTLDGLRAETWRKLEILQELTRLLPDGTWVQEVQLEEGTVEIGGMSTRAADLVQPLENSRYFFQVEFTSPITRDAQNKEVFRMRMRLRQPARF